MFLHAIRHDVLNANTFFNNRNLAPDPKTGKAPEGATLRQNQPGFNVGGPIVIPGLWDGHDKAFFFFNYEETALAEQHHGATARRFCPGRAER